MDPDADLPNNNGSSGGNNRRRYDNNDRLAPREVALPNSSRRAQQHNTSRKNEDDNSRDILAVSGSRGDRHSDNRESSYTSSSNKGIPSSSRGYKSRDEDRSRRPPQSSSHRSRKEHQHHHSNRDRSNIDISDRSSDTSTGYKDERSSKHRLSGGDRNEHSSRHSERNSHSSRDRGGRDKDRSANREERYNSDTNREWGDKERHHNRYHEKHQRKKDIEEINALIDASSGKSREKRAIRQQEYKDEENKGKRPVDIELEFDNSDHADIDDIIHEQTHSQTDDDTIEIEYYSTEEDEVDDGGDHSIDIEGDFEEDIEEANYTHHNKSDNDNEDDKDSDFDLDKLAKDDTSECSPPNNNDVPIMKEISNSPELNPNHITALEDYDKEELRNVNLPLVIAADTAAGGAALTPMEAATPDITVLKEEGEEGTQTSAFDPPIQGEDDINDDVTTNMDPNDDNKSLFSRLNAPPSPAAGIEINIKRKVKSSNIDNICAPPVSPPTSGGGGRKYSNYALDEEGHHQYQQQTQQQQPQKQGIEDADDGMSRMSIRGQDPPESGRGCEPKQTGKTDPPLSSSPKSQSHLSKKYRDRGGGGRSKGSSRKSKTKEKKKQPEIKSILKKKDTPIPITQFGKPIKEDEASEEDSFAGNSVGSDPDILESKYSASTTTLQLSSENNSSSSVANISSNNDDKSVVTEKSVNTAKSGLRSGKYATVNAMAVWKQGEDNAAIGSSDITGSSFDNGDGGDDDSSRGEISDYTGDYFSYNDGGETYISDNDDDGNNSDNYSSRKGGGHNEYDDDDETTLKSISTNTNQRFDRSKSHFLRTADLGLTQDTVFAEQFLDDLNAKAEPHYHIPSLHPPPGVQFNIDENWVCLDDGKGSHSPIAPQSVDALVAMGYRAASDPMMWTPISKTRKYMTEKKLRFDDIPLPGPLEEGDGSPENTSTCLVWSGKFPHKYHGHEQPAIRSQGIVNMSPEDLVDLLMDSRRVSEYNKSCIGRVDEVILSDGTDLDSCPFSGQRKKKLTGVVMFGAKIVDGTAVFDSETDDESLGDVEEIIEETFDESGGKSVRTIMSSKRGKRQADFVGVTKLVRTTNKPPLIRKKLEFFTLLHCRALTDDQGGEGYIIVGRGVTPAAEADMNKKGVLHSEILLNVHIIRRLRTSSSSSKDRSSRKKGNKSRGRVVPTSTQKTSKSDLANRCLMINVNHFNSPLVPNLLAKKVGLSAASNFITDIRSLTE